MSQFREECRGSHLPGRRAVSAVIAALAVVLAVAFHTSPAVAADVVANPGPISIELTGGLLSIGDGSVLPPVDIEDLGEDEAPSLTGTVNADGNISIPKESVIFPDLPLEQEVDGLGQLDLLVTILAVNDVTGQIDPGTGAATLNVDLRIEVRGGNGTNLTLPESGTCAISPIPLRLTTGTTSPPAPTESITGVPYDSSNGTARIVDNAFPVPAIPKNDCGKFLGFIDVANLFNIQLSVPLPAGTSSGELQVQTTPTLTAPGGPIGDEHTLTIDSTGDGSGTVTASPAGPEYTEGTEVTLTANPAQGSTFDGWTGCDSETAGKCVVTMDQDRTVGAGFKLGDPVVTHTLTIDSTGDGTGTVTASPAGPEYAEGTQVTLTANPAQGSTFEGWTGCDTETNGKCVVTMDEDHTVNAAFDLVPVDTTHSITVNTVGNGTGSAIASPAGPIYDEGTEVTLTPAPNAASTFTGWSGCDSESNGDCVVTMNHDRTVGASFEAVADPFQAGNLKLTLNSGWIKVLAGVLPPVEAASPDSEPITLTAPVEANGGFTSAASNFNFPSQVIPMSGDDPLIAMLLGSHIDLDISASSSFSGTFSAVTGGLRTSIPLNLTLGFNGSDPFSCILPLTINFDTNGKLVFPSESPGGQPTVYSAARFASPNPRAGALYGQWDAVEFADVQSGPGVPPEACTDILGLLPVAVPDWPVGLTGIDGELWLSGLADFTPKTNPPNAGKPRLGNLKIKPKRRAVKRGKKAVIRVKVKNTGKAPAKQARVCVKAPKRHVRVKRCVKLGKIAPKNAKVAKFRVKVKPKAKRGKKVALKFKATAKRTPAKKGKAVIRIK